MASNSNLLNLLSTPHRPETIIGLRGADIIRHIDFLTHVTQWRSLLSSVAGKNIALYFNDSIEFAAALFGAWHAGKTVYLPADTLPVTCASLHPMVDHFVGEFPADCTPLTTPTADVTVADLGTLNTLSADFTGLVVFTSGSTGTPQAIPKKLSQLATEVASLEKLFGKEVHAVEVVATVSHQHIYGLLFKVLWPLVRACPIHARSLTYPEELAQATAARACILISSPAHLKRLPDSPAWVANAHQVRAVFSSGGPLSLDMAQATAELLGQAPIEVYGSSETGGIAWRQRNISADDNWLLMPDVDARIAADGETLEIRSPHLPENAWFRTSDRARMVDERRFMLYGRADRIVKIEEKRVSLDLIESQLMRSPWIAEARVLVAAGRRERIAAFVALSPKGRSILANNGKLALNTLLRDWLADAVERIALPRSWRYLDALPVNAQGKTTQTELMALLDNEPPTNRSIFPRQQLIEKEERRALFELVAPRELLYFDGHFPQTPILPGVAQVEWAMQFAHECFDLPAPFRALHALKFQQVIVPEMPFSLELVHDPAKNSVAFRYFSPSGAHASGRLIFGASDV